MQTTQGLDRFLARLKESLQDKWSDKTLLMALQDMLAGGVIPFIDEREQPQVSLPGEQVKPHYPVRSPRVRSWLIGRSVLKSGKRPDEGYIKTLIDLLEHAAYENGVRETPPEDTIDSHMVFPALQEFMTWGNQSENPQEAYNQLTHIAKSQNETWHKDNWPENATAMSRLLGRPSSTKALEALGITFGVLRSNDRRRWRFTRMTPGDATRQVASRPKPKVNKNLRRSDASDAIPAEVFEGSIAS